MKKVHSDIVVSGRIFNIGFTFLVLKNAEKHNLLGKTKYLDENRIKIEVEGAEEEVEKFIEWCKSGIPEANVNNVLATIGDFKNYNDFLITD
ncbi:MAG: hypothetical protein HN704_06295 [Bacteroidetes bacterium]|nr:hypothetical protein [Bacteroidota bacterium]MBT6686210.1 hypothetical protein [Bacteroidota bacterium]MBT7143644.1 hypothetical protein [Bacteroidota bacterium]MBT7491198.1 hypothetical protein [Bacteroidota bacterium]